MNQRGDIERYNLSNWLSKSHNYSVISSPHCTCENDKTLHLQAGH